MRQRKLPILITLLFLLILFFSSTNNAYAQYDVYANQLISNSSDFQNASRLVDTDPTNYAKLSLAVGVLSTSDFRVRFPERGNAGDVINITIQDTGSILSLDLLDDITIKLYDSAGTTPVATVSGSSLLQLNLLTPGTNIYNIKFATDVTSNFTFKEAKVEFNNILSASLISEFRVYGIYFQRPCPPVYANTVVSSGATPLLASVDNTDRIVDSNPDNYATMSTLISILGIGTAYVDLSFPQQAKPGDYVGFTIAATSGLLDVDILGGLTVITYDASGAVKETKSGSSVLGLKLLTGTTNRYSVGFITTSGTYRISKIRLLKTAVVGLLSNIRVYNGFHYAISRPPVTVSASGKTSFCTGNSVTLTAYDSLGATNYIWNTGALTSSITVSTSGTYYVEVTDSASCTRRSIPIGVTVNANPKPVIVGDSVLCLGATGSLNVGSAIYASQSWNTGATTNSISSVSSGKYYISVTDSNSCKGSDTITVVQNKLNITSSITPTTCSNTASGGISLSVSGGSGTYSFKWSNGSTTSSITGLKAGIYTCIVKDSVYNCSYNKSFSILASNTLTSKIAIVNTSACNQADGKVTLTVLGGSGTYSYLWSNGTTGSGLSAVAAGIYTVNITDVTSGCQIVDTVAIGDGNSSFSITPAITNSTSCSSPNGAASLSISGGSGTYSYTWSTGVTTSSVTGLKAGNYYVVVKDVANSCSKALTVVITNNSSLSPVATIVKPGCKKQNGSITISSVGGGSGSYNYSWSTGATSSSITALQAGTYLLTVTDASSGCSKQEVYTLTDSTGPSATLALTEPDCGTNGNGSISVTATGIYNTYFWSTGSTSKNLTSLKPGIYTLTVTDTTTNCSAVYQAVLTAKSQMRIIANPEKNTACASAADGKITVSLTGGSLPYSYLWSSGETSKDLNGKIAGTYNLTVTDANSCITTISVLLNTDSSKLLNATLSSITKATCNTATNGSAYVTVSGGKTPLSYSWSPGGSTTKDLINVIAGSYTLTVTDAVGCTKQVNAMITIDSAVSLNATVDSTKASGCSSSASGAVYVTVSGGSAPYSYQWKKGATIVAGTKNLSSVIAGSYTLTITDNNGCTLLLNATVPVAGSGVTVTLDSLHRPTCTVSADGKIFASVSGGLSPYTYFWSTGSVTEDLINANPGTHVLTATDANGCPGQLFVNLSFDTSKTLVTKVDSTIGAGCSLGASAALYITASGGTPPYSYIWSDGTTMSDLSGVIPGTYTVAVTDAKGCKANAGATLGIDTSRSIKAAIDSVEGAGCIGSTSGKIFVSTSRGVAPYVYLWSNGASTKDILNAGPGVYSVIIADAAGCSKTLSANVGIDTSKKIIISADSIRGASCLLGANGAIHVSIKGGKAPYAYSWSNGAITADLLNVIPGFYTLSVQDANGCTATMSATIGVDISKSISINGVSIKDAGCSGNASGAINVTVTGGIPPYTYNWSNGATSQDIVNIIPGNYTLMVKDAVGCSEEYSAVVKVDTANQIKVSTNSVVDAKCIGSSSGSISVIVSGGVAPYSYSWSNGAITKDLMFIPSGSYLLNVTDAIGCSAQLSANIGINNTNPVTIKLDSVKNVGCVDSLSGAIFVSVTGGSLPYNYMWSNGAITQDLIGVASGAYNLNVTDNAGCVDNNSVNIEKASPIKSNVQTMSISCYGGSDGSINVIVGGGTGAYTYKWADGNTSAQRTGLSMGIYNVKVTDTKTGCFDSSNIAITQPDSLKISSIVVKDSCLPEADGSIKLSVIGGTNPYQYAWSNGGNSDFIQNLSAKSYSVTVSDAKNCLATATIIVEEINCDMTMNIHDVITPNGDGKNDSWVIEGIEFYSNSQVQIVDKWGDLVYEKTGYDNTFNGVNSKTGAILPTGTYYYILRLNEANKAGGEGIFKGALLIQR
jgi:gliding motility-associated-like protein